MSKKLYVIVEGWDNYFLVDSDYGISMNHERPCFTYLTNVFCVAQVSKDTRYTTILQGRKEYLKVFKLLPVKTFWCKSDESAIEEFMNIYSV